MNLLKLQAVFEKFVGRDIALNEGQYDIKRGQRTIKRSYLALDRGDTTIEEILRTAAQFNAQAVFRGIEARIESEAHIYFDLERQGKKSFRIRGVEARWS